MSKISISQKRLQHYISESINKLMEDVIAGVPKDAVQKRQDEIRGLYNKAIEMREYIEGCDYISMDTIELNNIIRQILRYCSRKFEGMKDLDVIDESRHKPYYGTGEKELSGRFIYSDEDGNTKEVPFETSVEVDGWHYPESEREVDWHDAFYPDDDTSDYDLVMNNLNPPAQIDGGFELMDIEFD